MRRILGCVTPSPVQGYLHITLRQSVPLRSTNRQASAAKRWMCLRCYHRSSEHAWGSGRGIPSAPCLIDRAGLFREGRGSRTAFPKTPARALSTQTNNAADKPRKDLPSQEEGRRSHISKRFTKVMDHLQSNIFFAGQRLNDLTGYSGIEALKKDIEQQETLVQSTRDTLQKAREDYSKAIGQRSASQREVNELLQRKHAWTPNDLERFTTLYRSDHANEQAESAAQENLMAVERQAEAAAAKLSASILARYHEEQIWSDKIRRMSTWGTWGLMGVNVLLFLIFQIGVEPWRRKRLVKGFEDKVMEALEREGTATGAAITEVEMAEAPPAVVDGDAQMLEIPEDLPDASLPGALDLPPENDPTEAHSASHFDSQPPTLRFTYKDVREWMRDLFSERQIVLRRLDLTTATLEGAAAGAAAGVAFVGVLVLLLRPR